MAAIVQAIDYVADSFRPEDKKMFCKSGSSEQAATVVAYFVFSLCASVVGWKFSDGDFSAVLTLGAGIQCLGLFLLSIKVNAQRSVEGLSSKTLEMYVLFFLTRLSSTLCKNGYIPVDQSGDWAYQAADIGALLITLQLIYTVHKKHRFTYQAEHDTLPIHKVLPGLVLVALFVHGDLNNSPFFDVIWMFSLLVDTVAMLPQLWMLAKMGGEVELLTKHFVAAMVMSRALSFSFWFYGYPELAPEDGGFNVTGYAIIAAYSMQILLAGDFMMHYVRSVATQERMVLPTTMEV